MKPMVIESEALLEDFSEAGRLPLQHEYSIEDIVVIDGCWFCGLRDEGHTLLVPFGTEPLDKDCPQRFKSLERERFTIVDVQLFKKEDDTWMWRVTYSDEGGWGIAP